MKKKEITKEGKVLLIPDQFEVKPLGDLMREIFEADFRKHCDKLGIDPNSIRLEDEEIKP